MALEELKAKMGVAKPAEAPQTGVRVSTTQPAAEAEVNVDEEAAELERVLAEAEGRRQNQRS